MNGSGRDDAALNRAAETIARMAIEAVDPGRLIRESVIRENRSGRDAIVVRGRSFDLDMFERVFLVAFGKAAPAMAKSIGGILGERLTGGIVVSLESGLITGKDGMIKGFPPETGKSRGPLEFIKGSHPLPDEGSLEGSRRVLAMVEGAGEKDLVLVCISGGGSALLCHPAEGIALEEKRRVTQALLKAGADIGELNTVRKHLSAVKGGRLAKAAFPATVVSLILSDVLGNDLASIASGPTTWDPTTFAEAKKVLNGFGLWKHAPSSVRDFLEKGIRGEKTETLKEGDPVLERTYTVIIGDNMTALEAAKKEADRLGFEPLILTAADRGEARRAAAKYAAFLANMACAVHAARKPLCFLAGGELTVTVRGKGTGGRNTEFVLASLVEFEKEYLKDFFCGGREASGLDWLVLSQGTDGIDGPTDAAGAWAGPETLDKLRELRLDPVKYLDDNDSYACFKKTGNLIITGPTGTNVMDIRIFLLGPA